MFFFWDQIFVRHEKAQFFSELNISSNTGHLGPGKLGPSLGPLRPYKRTTQTVTLKSTSTVMTDHLDNNFYSEK